MKTGKIVYFKHENGIVKTVAFNLGRNKWCYLTYDEDVYGTPGNPTYAIYQHMIDNEMFVEVKKDYA